MKAPLLIVVCALAAACADRREVRGLVLKVTPSSITVSHEPIPGYMDAMVMQVTAARSTELRDVHPGDRIQFRMTVGRQTTIDRIRILSAAPPSAPEAKGFNLCVQWHPEWQAERNPVSLRLFAAFGAACRAYRERHRDTVG